MAASRNETVRHLVANAPISRDVVKRFVAGESTKDAVEVVRNLGLPVTLDYLGEHTTDQAQAERTVQAYLELLDALHAAGWPGTRKSASSCPRSGSRSTSRSP